jgi:hypothetical protein
VLEPYTDFNGKETRVTVPAHKYGARQHAVMRFRIWSVNIASGFACIFSYSWNNESTC